MTRSAHIERIAAAWLARHDAGAWSGDDQTQFDAWLAESIAHRVAFLRLDAAWRQSARLQALGAGVPEGLIPPRGRWADSPFFAHDQRQAPTALHRAKEHSLLRRPDRVRASPVTVDLPMMRFSGHASRRRNWRPVRFVASVVAVCLLVALSLAWRRYTAVEQASYQTPIGVLRTVTLSDGSEVTLSSDSRIHVVFSHGERDINLQRGEAFFKVAKDAHRPFVVSSDQRRVIAVGTRFDVRRESSGLRVVVTQGVVKLETDSPGGSQKQPTTYLPAGSIALATRSGVVVRTGSVQTARQYANWRSGYFTFHDTPMTQAVAEFNRYNARKIVIGDAAVASMRVGGNFRWSNQDTFVRLLEMGFPIRVERHDHQIVLYHR